MAEKQNIQNSLKENSPKILLAIFLLLFLINSIYLALNLKQGIIPDEPAHFIFSKHFSTTLGIPPDTSETYSWGWYIQQNPFLYHWIAGRIINITKLIFPEINDWNLLIVLRLSNVLFSLFTIIFCFLIARELIKHKWWQILPVFLLINTLMFLFLSSGVNYDNLANLFCAAGLYFFIRVFTRNDFIKNSLSWLTLIGLGCLVKYTILPLALAMGLAWIAYIYQNRKSIPLNFAFNLRSILVVFVTVLILVGNFAIYGVNMISYQSIRPPCREILLESQCKISPYEQRNQEMAPKGRLSIRESIQLGYPSPLRYAVDDWVENMLMRTFGLIGHKSYFPIKIISLYQVLFYSMFFFGMFNLIVIKRLTPLNLSLLWVIGFYSIVLLVTNYKSELLYQFLHISFQGRYIFPIISIIYLIYTKTVRAIPIKAVRLLMLVFTLSLFFYGGLFTLFKGYNTFLVDWFR